MPLRKYQIRSQNILLCLNDFFPINFLLKEKKDSTNINTNNANNINICILKQKIKEI